VGQARRQYFGYSPASDFEYFDTIEEALDWAAAEIDMYRDDSADEHGWDEGVQQVMVGRLHAFSVQTKDEPAPAGSPWPRKWDFGMEIVQD